MRQKEPQHPGLGNRKNTLLFSETFCRSPCQLRVTVTRSYLYRTPEVSCRTFLDSYQPDAIVRGISKEVGGHSDHQPHEKRKHRGLAEEKDEPTALRTPRKLEDTHTQIDAIFSDNPSKSRTHATRNPCICRASTVFIVPPFEYGAGGTFMVQDASIQRVLCVMQN